MFAWALTLYTCLIGGQKKSEAIIARTILVHLRDNPTNGKKKKIINKERKKEK